MSMSDHQPLAVVGMSCRYPGGVRSPEDLWQVAVTGREVLSPFPGDRGWSLESLHHGDPGHPGTSYVDRGGFLDDVAGFDPGFFGISPREATSFRAVTHHGISRDDIDRAVAAAAQAAGEVFGD